MSSKYVAISCAFYDELESSAVKKENSIIIYKDNEEVITIHAVIVDFKTQNKEEFLILSDGTKIRLDTIISFNSIKPTDKDYC